jgi:hypothetical protein
MSKTFATHKETDEARHETIARKMHRAAKYSGTTGARHASMANRYGE